MNVHGQHQFQIQFDKIGEPLDVLVVRENQPIKQLLANQVLIKVKARPINPSDLLYVKGIYLRKPESFPAVCGFEGAGDVVEVGSEVKTINVGQRVHFLTSFGSWSEYAITTPDSVIPLPNGISYELGCQIFVNPATAYGLLDASNAQPGEWVLQTAAGSSLGRVLIRLAKIKGIKTINIVRRAEQVADLKALGADEVIVSTTENVLNRIKEITGGKGVRNIFDCVAGDTSELQKTLGYMGTIWIYGALGGPAQINVNLLWKDNTAIRCFHIETYLRNNPKEKVVGLFTEMFGYYLTGQIDLPHAPFDIKTQLRDAILDSTKEGKIKKTVLISH